MESYIANLKEYSTQLISVGVVFALFLFAGQISKWVIIRIGKSKNPSTFKIYKLIGTTSNIGLIIMGIVTALGTLGIDISAIVASLGLTGFAVGFAFKDALSNFLAGIMVILYKPYDIGDHVNITGCEGKIIEIDLRYTTIENDGEIHMVPNSVCLSKNITKYKNSKK
mgnify:CR=1 FL=1|jgi:small-conductance mechanosensitive channel|tara:strand:- start:280 stop:783 length:504 start_codon:yes stop_codon:yes gene_type:complete